MRRIQLFTLLLLVGFGVQGQTGVQFVTPSAAQATEDINENFTQTNPTEYASVTQYSTDWETLINDTSSINEANIKTVSFNNEWMYGEGPTITYNETITDATGGGIFAATTTTVLGSLKSAYWAYKLNGGSYKAKRIEFRINGGSLEVRQTLSRYTPSSAPPSLSDLNDNEFTNNWATADAVIFELDLIEISYAESASMAVTVDEASILVGLPYMGIQQSPYDSSDPVDYTQYTYNDIGFPWGVNYFPSTFQDEGFTVSKGYFSDKVELNWRVYNNEDRITGFEVYRTEDINSDNPSWGEPIRNLSSSVNTFTDLSTEGGRLYRYKIKALGAVNQDPDILYDTYMEGIGYRNPTGIITGNVSYEGGNPVKDVTIAAVPDGGFENLGSALQIPEDSFINIPRFHENLSDSITLQTWVKPVGSFTGTTSVNLFSLQGSADTFVASLRVASETQLNIQLGDYGFTLEGYYPNGRIDNKGDDVMSPISAFTDQFNHLSFVFEGATTPQIYINGRKINADYLTTINTYVEALNLDTEVISSITETNTSSFNISMDADGNGEAFTSLNMGGGVTAYFDEMRMFNVSLSDEIIRRDYKRYLKGNEAGIHTYLRMDEKNGYFAYDLAHKGFTFYGNDARLKSIFLEADQQASWVTGGDQKPTSDQLGILGITDENGNYVVAAVPYKGTGETYLITPSLGKHQFSPNQEIAFIGVGAEVINNVDFIDKSSFTFRGRVLYDSRGVFPEGPDSDDVTGDIRDGEAYNAYIVGDEKYPKGEYWAEYGTGTESATIVRLNRYAPIPLRNALVYVDDQLVIGSGNNPVETDNEGRFTIEVPIGEHHIKVKKYGHVFEHEGRFPKVDTLTVNGETEIVNRLFDFYEDQDEEVVFIDNTKVAYVGRVVGGAVEGDKPLGFGFDGEKSYQASPTAEAEIYTSKNNIGTASITLGYRQPGVSSITDEYKTIISTHPDTGEFRVNLLPLRYELDQNDLDIPSQTDPDVRRFLEANQILNLSAITVENQEHFIVDNDTIASTLPFNYKSKFVYRSTPEISVLEQTSDSEIVIEQPDGDITYTVSNTAFNLYSQGVKYKVKVQKQERYFNFEKATDEQLDVVPVTEGELVVTNNLADSRSGSQYFVEDENDASLLTYYFKAGVPNTDVSSNFRATISMLYRLNGTDYSISGYQTEGVILGSKSSGGQTFETAGPEIPDIILRDPPGSESFATIEQGSSFAVTRKNAGGIGSSINASIQAKLGLKVGVGGGLLGPLIESESYVAGTTGIGFGFSSEFGSELTTNYTFSQAISTSDDPDWVGADADLYIGTSYNQFYGVMDDIKVTESAVTDTSSNSLSISLNTTSGTLYVSKSKALFFSPGEEKTVFIYSQWQILNDIIPYYNEIYENYECIVDGTDPCPLQIEGDLKPKLWYNSQINLWRRVIQINEETKYLANSDRNSLQDRIETDIIDNFSRGFASLGGVDNDDNTEEGSNLLNPGGQSLKELYNQNFFENISFDSGVGEFTKSISSGKTNVEEFAFTFELEQTNELEVVLDYGGNGGTIKFENKNTASYEHSGNREIENTLEVSYTLKDGDDYNKLSVDVVNAFDGNGPVFVTKGGETSCPVEEAAYSYFFNPEEQPVAENSTATVVTLAEENRIEISKGTVAIEVPFISVENASLVGIPEARAAEFKIQLRNDSVLEPEESDFILYVDQTTNPDNAIINLDDSGTPFYLNGGDTVEFTVTLEKGSNNVYDYEDIRIVFESMCDDDLSEEIFISASFIESCSSVAILNPLENWVMNRSNGYNTTGESVPMEIELQSFDYESESFERIDLEYRLESSPTWTNLKTYVASETILAQLIANGESNVTTITGTEFTFSWDIAGEGLADGNYEIRARATCLNGTEYTSEVVPGKVDLTAPVLFGTPAPTDGVLSLGDDILARFSENVKANGTLTRYEFKVQKNQLPVRHEVSLAFSDDDNVGEIESPFIQSGDFSVEFWLKNTTTAGSGALISQENGVTVRVTNNQLTFILGSESVSAPIATDGTYNHYALAYEAETGTMRIIENDTIILQQVVTQNLNFNSNNSIFVGGNNFRGNLHDLRLWRKALSREDAVAYMNELLSGDERDLLGYWPMNEGNGSIAKDLARSKNMGLTNIDWDIFPKTDAYAFDGSNHLRLEQAGRAIITKDMDATLSFWFKTAQAGEYTLVSNGRGDLSDTQSSSGYRNKWSIDMNAQGYLALKAENESYDFGVDSQADNLWHHVAIVVRRNGSLLLYVDGKRTASYGNDSLGGFASSTLFVGARGQLQVGGSPLIDRHFVGEFDELRVWNMAKTAEQIEEDRFYEADYESIGMLLYAPFNAPEQTTGDGPRYWYPYNSFEMRSDVANLASNTLAYTTVVPPLKPKRPTEKLIVDAVINQDEVLMTPVISDWASIENKIAYITIANLYDESDNRQESPVSWTAFINKNPLKWFVEGEGTDIEFVKEEAAPLEFDITIRNRSGVGQPYEIITPAWISIDEPSGSVPPSGTIKVRASVDANISSGLYEDQILLTSDYNFNEKISISLRITAQEPDWGLNPAAFEQSMTLIGKVRIDNTFSNDPYDRLVAYRDDKVRGVVGLTYDEDYDDYYALLTVYSNPEDASDVSFKIWDASAGRLKNASVNTAVSIPFVENALQGNYQTPLVFDNTGLETQEIRLNTGWTWVSFNVETANFSDLNALFQNLEPATSDLIQTAGPARFDQYEEDQADPQNSGWFGTISTNNGINSAQMYKLRFSQGQKLLVSGTKVDLDQWTYAIQQNWNWLPYVVGRNVPINEALANMNAQPGDLIKSQNQFAIYDGSNGWKGSLTYLYSGQGYMLKATNAQSFSYPSFLNLTDKNSEEEVEIPTMRPAFASYPATMNLVGKIGEHYDGIEIYNEANELVAKTTAVASQEVGFKTVFTTVYGNDYEDLKVYFVKNGERKLSKTELLFIPDAVYGSLNTPMLIEDDLMIKTSFDAFPNPFINKITVGFKASTTGTANVYVYDLNNREIACVPKEVSLGENTLEIQLNNLVPGTYILQLHMNGSVYSKLLLKE